MSQWRCGISELKWSAKQDLVHVHLERSWSTRVRVSLEASSFRVSEPSVLLPTQINANSMFESDLSVLKQMAVILSTGVSSSFWFHKVSWPNGDLTADSRSKQSKRSPKRSLHKRKGDWMDWNTPVIRSFDGGTYYPDIPSGQTVQWLECGHCCCGCWTRSLIISKSSLWIGYREKPVCRFLDLYP